MIKSNLKDVQSSEDLLKSAWSSIGLTKKGRGSSEADSLSAAMAASAGSAAVESAKARTETAEEIAGMLAAETQQRSTSGTSRRAATPRRQPAPPRQAAPPPVSRAPRPRRADTQLPPTRAQQPAPVPQPPRAPQPTTVPQPRQPEQQSAKAPSRRGFGWLVFAAIWIISAIVGLIGGDSGTSTPDISINVPETTIDFEDLTPTTLAGDVDLINIREIGPGACIESLPPGDVIDDVPVVPCAASHQYEVFAIATLDESPAAYPGFEEVVDSAFDACLTFFLDYTGEEYPTSQWYVDVVTPTEVGWTEGDDRTVNCLLYIWDEDAGAAVYLTGTASESG